MKPQSKAPAIWMQVAAAILLLLIGGWFFLTKDTSSIDKQILAEKKMIEEEEPRKETLPTEVMPPLAEDSEMIAKAEDKEPATAPRKKVTPAVQPQKVEIASTRQEQVKREAPVVLAEVEKKEEPIDVVLPEQLEIEEMETQVAVAVEESPKPEVRITYIADDDEKFLQPVRELIESEKQREKKSGFSKLIASARSITNGDILADLRDSKDELFNGNLKLNKEEKVNNSK